MSGNNVTPQEIYEVLEQQKKLQNLRAKLVGVLNKINQTINSITVENFELTSSQIDSLENEDAEIESNVEIEYNPASQEARAEEINQTILDLETKLSQYETETDEELDDL